MARLRPSWRTSLPVVQQPRNLNPSPSPGARITGPAVLDLVAVADIQPLLGVAKPGEGVLLLAHLAEGVHTGIAVTGFHESLLQAAIAGRVGQSKVDCF